MAVVAAIVGFWMYGFGGRSETSAVTNAGDQEEATGSPTLEAATLESANPTGASTRNQLAPAPLPDEEAATPEVTAPGLELNLTVLRDELPVSGVLVWIHPWYGTRTVDLHDVRSELPAGALQGVTDAMGRVRFENLGRDPFRVALRPQASETPAQGPDRHPSTQAYPGHEYTISIGTSSVFGTVYDTRGNVRPNVGVQAHTKTPHNHTHMAAQVSTNERGEYRIESLAAGDYSLTMEPDGRFDGHGEVERRLVKLARSSSERVDFGSPLGALRWTGRLLNAFGEPFLGRGRLVFNEAASGIEATAVVDESGRFGVDLSPGRWRVHATCTGSPTGGFDLGETIVEHDQVQDLTVPGIRVSGTLSPPDVVDGDPLRHSWTQISFRLVDHDYPAAFRNVCVDAQGRYHIDGLEPGRWRASIWPGKLAGPDPVIVHLSEADREVTLNLLR